MIGDRFLFVFGPNHHRKDRLAVLRVGGHVEAGETPWECAVREVREETGLAHIQRVDAAETLKWQDGSLQPFPWEGQEPRPMLVLPRSGGAACNVMFLARARGVPFPSGEVNGLLLLSRYEMQEILRRPTTLQEFVDGGGWASMRSPYPRRMILEPLLQCRLLASLLEGNRLKGVIDDAVSGFRPGPAAGA